MFYKYLPPISFISFGLYIIYTKTNIKNNSIKGDKYKSKTWSEVKLEEIL